MKSITLTTALLAMAILTACDDKTASTPTPGKTGGATTQPSTDYGAWLDKAGAVLAAGRLTDAEMTIKQLEDQKAQLTPSQQSKLSALRTSLDTAKASAVTVPPPVVPPVTTAPATPPVATVPAAPIVDVPAGDKTQQATDLLTKVTGYIQAKKWPDAETALKELDGMKSSLPASLQTRIDQAHAAFTTAKGASALIPGLGG